MGATEEPNEEVCFGEDLRKSRTKKGSIGAEEEGGEIFRGMDTFYTGITLRAMS